jgi:hypothetical protein
MRMVRGPEQQPTVGQDVVALRACQSRLQLNKPQRLTGAVAALGEIEDKLYYWPDAQMLQDLWLQLCAAAGETQSIPLAEF